MTALKRKEATIALEFAKDFKPNKHLLLELCPQVSEEIEKGNTLKIKGSAQTMAVLCTSTNTFEIKKSESSNCSLLIPPVASRMTETTTETCNSDGDGIVTSTSNFHYEIALMKPDLSLLVPVLSSPEHKEGLLLDQLESIFPASKAEIKQELEKKHASCFGGKWKILSSRRQVEVFESVLTTIIASGWSVQEIPRMSFEAEHDIGNSEEVEMAMKPFLTPETSEDYWSLCPEAIAQFRAKSILKQIATGKEKPTMEAFLRKWKLSLPLGVTIEKPNLKGIALLESEDTQHEILETITTIRYFDAQKMSRDPKLRFAKLFQARERWALEDLEPYIEPLVQPNLSMAVLLKRYTRVSRNKDGTRSYSAR